MVAWLVGLISHHFTFKLSNAEISEKLESLRCRSLEKRSRTRQILAGAPTPATDGRRKVPTGAALIHLKQRPKDPEARREN
jgi:hypothetical protein